MPTADAYIEALQRRMRLHAYRTRGSDGIPRGWDDWFVPGPPPVGAREHVDAIVAELAARPPRAPETPGPDPGPWRAFLATWRQGWEPPDPEDRPLRIFAGGLSIAWHVALFFAMLWLLLTGFDRSAALPLGEEDVVQVEFIGDGAPDEAGGGAADVPEALPDGADATAPAAAAAAPSRAVAGAASPEPPAAPEPAAAEPPLPAPAFEVTRPTPTPELAAATPSPPVEREIPMPAPREQPLQVSEPVPDTTTDFLLSPPTPALEPSLVTPELQAVEPRPVEREIPAPPRRLEPAPVAAPAIAGAELELPAGEVAEREIPMPAPATPLPPAPQLRVRTAPAPEASLEPGQQVVQERGIPMPVRAPVPDTSTGEGGAAQDVAAAEEGTEPEARVPGQQAASADIPAGATRQDTGAGPVAGTGPRPVPAPGGWTDPVRGDDWGAADRQRDGAQAGDLSGLYDSAGRVRLAETPGSSASGDPPGTITEEIANLDRAGTWLRRPPIGYEPTSFDRFWRPNETLLEEWVRRSVTTVRIPIPGTSKTLVCQTVMLAMGGGCGIEDPNMVEQPASARPPPDIPFKPELQEGGGTGPAAG